MHLFLFGAGKSPTRSFHLMSARTVTNDDFIVHHILDPMLSL